MPEQENLVKAGQDFLRVMGNHQERRWVGHGRHLGYPVQELFPGEEVEPVAWFIKDQEFRVCHQGPGNHYRLAFPLGEDPVGAADQLGPTGLNQELLGPVHVALGVLLVDPNASKLAG